MPYLKLVGSIGGICKICFIIEKSNNLDKDYFNKVKALLNKRSYENLVAIKKLNREELSTQFSNHLKLLELLFDKHLELIENYEPLMELYVSPYPNTYDLVYTSVIKNINSLFAVIELTKDGQFGAAKNILRQIFEFLMLAKYCGITKDEKTSQDWINGSNIDLFKKTIKYLKEPYKNSIVDFWKILCLYNHGTVHSQQGLLYWRYHSNYWEECTTFLYMLIMCNHHLFNRVFLPLSSHLKYNAEVYRKEEISKLKKEISIIQKTFEKQLLGKQAIIFVKHYCRSWEYTRLSN